MFKESAVRKCTRKTLAHASWSVFQAFVTLGVVMGAFLLCWLPFFSWYLTVTICGEACTCPDILVATLFWIGQACELLSSSWTGSFLIHSNIFDSFLIAAYWLQLVNANTILSVYNNSLQFQKIFSKQKSILYLQFCNPRLLLFINSPSRPSQRQSRNSL